jgi:monovalent cation:proton antiporter-2 (CPA2) family protein
MSTLFEVIIYLTAAIIAVPISKRFGLGSILGYLIAGVLIGPSVLGIISNAEHTLHFAELGVVFLLFVIGLELQPSRLWVLRRMVFGLGSMQVVLSALAITLLAMMFGMPLKQSGIIGVILALSSTAFVLQMLAEKKQLTMSHGRAAFTILLFQDLAVIPLIAFIPLLGSSASEGMSFNSALLKIGVIFGLVAGGRYLLRPILRIVARTGIPELFTASALLVVIGSALLMQQAEISMALGAFVAGMLLADSEFRHELEADIAPFKGLLLGLFFMAVGMTVNLELLANQPVRILVIVALLMSTKIAVLLPLAGMFGVSDFRSRIKLAAVMSQGGEFAFVLFALVARENLIERPLIDQLILAVAVSMMLTPLIYAAVEKLAEKMASKPKPEYDQMDDEHNAVIIAGFGRVGQIVGRLLRIANMSFTALEMNPSQVDVVRRFGSKVHFGDASKPELLRAAGAQHAKILVLAISNIETSLRIAETVSRNFPDLKIVARARNRQHEYKLMDLGIEHIFRETLLSSIALGQQVMSDLGIEEKDARHIAELFEQHDRKMIIEQHAVHHDEERLYQSTKDTARELESLLNQDLNR